MNYIQKITNKTIDSYDLLDASLLEHINKLIIHT